MKNYLLLFTLLFMLQQASSQVVDCIEDFEMEAITPLLPTVGNWQTINGLVAFENKINISGSPSRVLRGLDGNHASWMYNNLNYQGDWLDQGCEFCFDILYEAGDPSNPATGIHTLRIYQGGNPNTATITATFVVNNPIGNVWQRVCAPIEPAGTSLPSNAEGKWVGAGVTTVGWNTLISGVSGISFFLDFGGGSHPSENVYVDNLCFESCPDPCDSIELIPSSLVSIPDNGLCCVTVDVVNNFNGTYFTSIVSTILTPGVNFLNPIGNNGWTATPNTPNPGNVLTWSVGQYIGQTTYGSALNFCLTDILQASQSPQHIKFDWMVGDSVVCSDTIAAFCEPCVCDLQTFCQTLDNEVTTSIDNNLCKVTVNIGNLPECDYIESINWGNGQVDNGPFSSGGMVMHTYAESGTYEICYLAIELDSLDFICFEKYVCDTINLQCPITSDTCIIPPTGLVAWWPMDEMFGDVLVVDTAGKHNGIPKPGGSVGLPNGPNAVPGKVGGALHFISAPGTSYVEVNDGPNINFGTGSFSIDAWIYTDMGTQTQPIVDKLGPLNAGYSLSIQGTSPYYLTLVLGSGTSVHYLQGPAINVGEWNFVAVSVNTQTNIASFYVGNNSGSKLTHIPISFTGTTDASNSRPLLIGNNTFNPHWNIIIDELEIFKRALDSIELAAICSADSLGKCKDVIIGVSDLNHERKIQVFPNPTDGNITLQFDNTIPVKSHVQIINIEGRILQKILLNSGQREHSLSISDLPPGLYFIKITEDGMPVGTKKIIKL